MFVSRFFKFISSNIIQQRDSKDTYKSIRYIKGATKPIAKHFIGEKFGGGIIFKVTPDGLHGLIAETQDQGQSIFSLAEYRAEYHSGSDSILHSIPARKFYGWHLPNAEELDLLFHQKDVVGGFSDVLYWSSTKDKDDIGHRAFSEGFGIGNKNSFPITSIHSIRAIREF